MKRLLTIVLVVALTAGCSLQTAGAKKGKLRITATFDDVQHLVPGHAVRIADTQVGSVMKVALDGYRAKVTMAIADGHPIPQGTTAHVAQTSLLGENFVALTFPDQFDPVKGPFVASGADLSSTPGQPQLEEVAERAVTLLGALSADDLTTILSTASQALNGKGPELNTLISQLADVGQVYAGQRGNIAAVIDGLGRLGDQLAASAPDIEVLISNVANATGTLASQRDRLVTTLTQLTKLATALNDDVLEPHTAQLRTLLAQLDPVLASVAHDRATLDGLITNVLAFSKLLPKAENGDSLLLYSWFNGFIGPNGEHVPLLPSQVSGEQAVSMLLSPTAPAAPASPAGGPA